MLSINDLLDYCDLSREEIAAIAEHEHLPLAVAAELSETLLETPEGVAKLHQMLLDDITEAKRNGKREHLRELVRAYLHLQERHPLPAAA